MRRSFIYVLLAVLVTSLTACQGADFSSYLEQAIAPEMATTATPAPTPKTLPDNFPQNIPIPPGLDLVGVYGDLILHWRSTSPQVIATYSQLLKDNGWFIQQTTDRQVRAKAGPEVGPEVGSVELILAERSPDIFLIYFPAVAPDRTPPAPNIPNAQGDRFSEDVAKLPGLGLTGATNPDQTVTRREYSRWLVRTNNLLFGDRASRQVRLSATGTSPFADLDANDPDFLEIVSLVNAGIIARSSQFRPDAPLTRQELVHMKIPFDLGQAPPIASRTQMQSLWSFQDGDQINDYAIRAIAADAQLGNKSNIRRSFGLTTILQPQKPVTRAEALASLWYFGTESDGISAADYNQKPKDKPMQ